ncbi:Uncharacterised protein [Mycobacteroides abscessus subsp. abscessus]|nr:Uncharacterised protein [Mycobacteroides abscessus subsp. abscessus]
MLPSDIDQSITASRHGPLKVPSSQPNRGSTAAVPKASGRRTEMAFEQGRRDRGRSSDRRLFERPFTRV